MAAGVLKRLFSRNATCSSSSGWKERGLVKVCVGREEQRQCKLEMKMNHLNHPLFKDLLSLSTEEFGYSYDGAVRIACDIDAFCRLLQLIESGDPSVHYMELSDILKGFRASGNTCGEGELGAVI